MHTRRGDINLAKKKKNPNMYGLTSQVWKNKNTVFYTNTDVFFNTMPLN